MADMRLIVVGAGGRMGRTLIHGDCGDRRRDARRRGRRRRLGGDRARRRRARRARHTTASRCAPTSSRCSRRPTACSTSPFRPRPSPSRSSPREHRLVHVIGTTGLTGENDKLIAEAAKRAIIVKSGNMSIGVNLLAALVKQVARTLGEEFDIEILEMHHNKKVDAPSGTALMLGQAAARRPRHRPRAALGARPRRPHRRAQRRRHRLRVAARRHRGRRSHA